jgi:signal transduction histidine kinase
MTGRPSKRYSLSALRADWREIGGLGRLALIGIFLALVLTVVLGFSITSSAENHLLEARATMIHNIVAQLPPLPADGTATDAQLAAYDVAVRTSVLGGETVRVKLWLPDGTIIYSDAADLIGEQFTLSPPAVAAFGGLTGTLISDLSDPAHELSRGEGKLIEIYIPLPGAGGEIASVIEVEQSVTSLDTALGRIATNVWLSIGLGIAALGVFMGTLGMARAREVNRRRRQAEVLLRSAFEAQEKERRRVVGALHDEVGQPLYRLLYGLEGSRAKMDPADPVALELDRLEDVVRDIDETLRRELRILHEGLAADAGLDAAVADLVELTRAETDLDVAAAVELAWEPTPVQRTALYRAAQEAVLNVRKHAGASRVRIHLRTERDRVVLDVEDDGIGVSGEPGLGLTTTKERFQALGGDVAVSTLREGGTRLRGWLPVPREST